MFRARKTHDDHHAGGATSIYEWSFYHEDFEQILVASVGSYYEQGKDGRIGMELFLFHLSSLLLDPFLLSSVINAGCY